MWDYLGCTKKKRNYARSVRTSLFRGHRTTTTMGPEKAPGLIVFHPCKDAKKGKTAKWAGNSFRETINREEDS